MRARELLQRMSSDDHVHGKWVVLDGQDCTVWGDASNVATGVCLDKGGEIVKDASWLREEDDGSHLNVAELEAVFKALTQTLKLRRTKVKVMTDSACVHGWLRPVLGNVYRTKVSGHSEMIFIRRMATLQQLIDEYGIELTVTPIPYNKNIADRM